MKIKRYLHIGIAIIAVFIIQYLYIDYTISNHQQQMVDLQLSLEENFYDLNNRIQHLENDVINASPKSFSAIFTSVRFSSCVKKY